MNAVGGTLASQWKEYFYLDAMPEGVLAAKANKKTKGRFGGSRNEDDNIISAGSVIAVNEGQCAMIVDQGKIVEFTAEPGEFVFDQNAEPSIFYGPFGTDKLKQILKLTFERFSFGGQAGKDQRVYFFNTKEITGNKYGTPSPVPFRVVDQNIGLDVDIAIKCFGEYSYRITNPMPVSYTHLDVYKRQGAAGDLVHIGRMPGDGCVQALPHMIARQERLARAALLAGTAKEDDRALLLRVLLQIRLDREGRRQRARAQQVMPAAMAAAARNQRGVMLSLIHI